MGAAYFEIMYERMYVQLGLDGRSNFMSGTFFWIYVSTLYFHNLTTYIGLFFIIMILNACVIRF